MANVAYAPGCYIMNTSNSLLADAVALANKSDLAIIVVGDNQATCQESWGGRTGDRADLDLPGGQLALIQAILNTQTPTVVVLINGRPATFGVATMNELLYQIPALLVAWRPGEEGGTAIVNAIFGDINPSGKLVSTWPWSVGQIAGPFQPYYQKYRQYDGMMYTFQPHVPLFPFGFGLSYTTFEFSNLQITPQVVPFDGLVKISVQVQNTGTVTGAEVVQLYIGDDIASVIRWNKQLFGFEKVFLNPGQSTGVSFTVLSQNLAFYNSAMQLVVEPGQFNVWVGNSSMTGLTSQFFLA